MFDPVAERVRTRAIVVVVLGLPDPEARSLVDFDRRIHDARGRRVAIIQSRRVDEGLERRARLPLRLGGAVELRLVEREAAHHGEDTTRIGIHGHDGAADIGNLLQPELSRLAVHRVPHRRRRRAIASSGWISSRSSGCRPGSTVPVSRSAIDLAGLIVAGLQSDPRRGVAAIEHDREAPGLHIPECRNRRQRRTPVAAKIDVADGAPEAMRFVESNEAVDKSLAGDDLELGIERGADRETAPS